MLRTTLTRSTGLVAKAGTRTFAAPVAIRSKHTLPDLSYDYGALEPAISAQIMELHHTKHHQTYVNGLNTAEDQLAEALHKKDVKSAIALQKAINFNGGGHINHTLFWENLAPQKNGGGELNDGVLKQAIERDFGGLEGLKGKFNAQIAAIQGSGWGWLGYNPQTKKLDIVTTANQDPLLCKYYVDRIECDANGSIANTEEYLLLFMRFGGITAHVPSSASTLGNTPSTFSTRT